VRLLRLALHRYGHLSDAELDFGDAAGLSVVLGANEAGKSTTLAALADGLFGFPHRTNYDYVHRAQDLRIGFILRGMTGEEAGFVRRKGNRQTLSDAAGSLLPETAVMRFLGGATRPRFETFFGLDGNGLRAGGDAILRGEGEVGETIMQAHTGMSGFRAAVERLNEEAGRLFGDRNGRRAFHVAVQSFHDARKDLERKSVRAADWKANDAALSETEAALRSAGEERARLGAERARLERIRRTAPLLATLRRALDARVELGVVPSLPPDAETTRLAAIAARDRATEDLARDKALLEACDARVRDLAADPVLLAEGEAIDALAADLNNDRARRRDREEQRTIAAQARRRAEDAGVRLGLAADADRLAAYVPDALRRSAAQHARTTVLTQAESLVAAQSAAREAEAALEDARAALDARPAPPDLSPWRDAIAEARGEGQIDAAVAEAAGKAAKAAQALRRRLAELPGWPHDAASLAAAPVPLEAEIVDAAAALGAAQRDHAEAKDRLASQDTSLAELDAALAALILDGEVPTADMLAALRGQRDAAWQALRTCLDAGVDPGELPAQVERLLHEADALADRRLLEAERIARHSENRRRALQVSALRDRAGHDLAGAATALARAEAAWQALWQRAGIAALAPDAMRDWLRRREAVLDEAESAEDAARHHASLAARRETVLRRLLDLAEEDPGPSPALAAVLRAAEARCAAMERQASATEKARQLVAERERALEAATRSVAARAAALDSARTAWRAEAIRLGLQPDTPAEAGQTALDVWQEVETESRDRRAAEDRIGQMTEATDGFGAATRDAATRAAPDLCDAVPEEAVRSMVLRLATAREAARMREQVIEDRSKHEAAIVGDDRRLGKAEGALTTLRRLAGAADDAALKACILRVGRAAELETSIAALRDELECQGDGHALEVLTQEEAAEAEALDTLPQRIAAIVERQDELARRNTEHGAELERLRQEGSAMEAGQHAGAEAQAMQDALAEMDDIAERYVRLRLAHRLLRAGMDEFRRQQQAPLLTRAGELFAELTDGRYNGLVVGEPEPGRLRLTALRADGTDCQADRLSEGTRDQLYLALRLAAIEAHAASADPLPFVADDLLVNFDDRRAEAALHTLARFCRVTQVILFTHHAHIAEMAAGLAQVLHLPATVSVPVPVS
jgi:chromosome segregation protein